MRDTKACRSCLNTADRLIKIPDNWYRMFETLTGVQASKNDGYPNYFCVECKSHIHKAITFRKKSRRAFYILKEIMLVRKEVNLPDILTVDRSKVSLDSSLGNFKPIRSAVYNLCTSEEEATDLMKEDLTMISMSFVIDIKGEMTEYLQEIQDLPAVEDDQPADMGDSIPEDNVEDSPQELETEEKEPEEEIDMNDIFKGLKEPESEYSDDDKPVEKQTKKKKKRKKGEPIVVKMKAEVNEYTIGVKARALLNYDVKKLTEDEQKEVFKKKISNPIFTKALYTCGICVKVMPSVDALMEHFEKHKNKTQAAHLCKVCKDKFVTAEELDLHIKETHLYQYTCKICQEEVYSVREMVKHKKEKHVVKHEPREPVPDAVAVIKAVDYEAALNDKFLLVPLSEDDKLEFFKKSHGVGKFVCDICGLGLPTNKQRQCHWQMHAMKPKNPYNTCRVQCGVCGVWCVKEAGLDKHMQAFHDYSYHCKLCSHETFNRYLAVDHLTRKHKEVNACHICGFTSRTPVGLDAHIIHRHQTELRSHHCVECGADFKTQFSLNAHHLRDHNFFIFSDPPAEGAENACTACNIQFHSTKAYHTHLVKAEHEGAKDLPWKCLPCRKLFDCEADMRSHAAEGCKHKPPVASCYPAPCHVCGDIMATYQMYYYHCQKKHPEVYYTTGGTTTGGKKLCDVCGKTYGREKKSRHNCFHGARYKCAVCDLGFERTIKLVKHVIGQHMSKPFLCTICNQGYKYRYDCKNHILKTHAPVRPYVCPICNREFALLNFLKSHAKKMHDVKVQVETKVPKKKHVLILYPNMKVDLSLIDKKIIDELRLKVADYTDQIVEDIPDYKDYVITSDDIRQVEEEDKDYKGFLIKNEDLKKEEETVAKRKKAPKKRTKQQAYRDFVFGEENEAEDESARTHPTFKREFNEFVVDENELQESTRTIEKINEEYITTDDARQLDGNNSFGVKKPLGFIIKNEDRGSGYQNSDEEYMTSDDEERIERPISMGGKRKPQQDHRDFIIRNDQGSSQNINVQYVVGDKAGRIEGRSIGLKKPKAGFIIRDEEEGSAYQSIYEDSNVRSTIGRKRKPELDHRGFIIRKDHQSATRTIKKITDEYIISDTDDAERIGRSPFAIEKPHQGFIIRNVNKETAHSSNVIQDYIIKEEVSRQGGAARKEPKDHRNFIIKKEDLKRKDEGPPVKKIKYINFEQEF